MRSLLLLSLPLLAASSVLAQQLPTLTLTASTNLVSADFPTATLVATLTPPAGTPLATYNGQNVVFRASDGSHTVPIENGVASVLIHPVLQGGQETVGVSYTPVGDVFGGAGAGAFFYIRPTALPTAYEGDYVLQMSTFTGSGPGGEGALVGGLTFSGNGGGTYGVSGQLDYNGKLGAFAALPVTGTYSVTPDGRGTMTLESSMGTQHITLLANFGEFAGTQTISQASLSEADGQLAGAGKLYRSSPFVDESATGEPLFDPSLVSLSGQYQTAAASFPVSVTGSVVIPMLGPATSVTADERVGAYVRIGASLALQQPTYLQSTLNRFPFTLIDSTQPLLPSHYVRYATNPSTLYVISTDPVPGKILLSGDITAPFNEQ